MYRGIDVSKHNGTVNFELVKRFGFDFVILRAGFGKSITQKDSRFEENYAKAKKAGLDVGAYWFSYALEPQTAELEARECIKALSGKRFEYPIYYDLEADVNSNYYPFKTGKENCSEMVKAFCNTLEKAGYWAGLYISRSPLQTHITEAVAKRYALWIAEYNTVCRYKGSYGMWQYSDSGIIAGHTCRFDFDYCYKDYPAMIKAKKLNGYNRKTAAEIAAEVLDGKWGNGEERKKLLSQAGYDYAEVQEKVNELLRK